MGLYPKAINGRARIQGSDGATPSKESFIAHYQASPTAPSATATKAAFTLAAGASAGITAGITNPDVPRNVTAKGNASGIAGNVVVHGKRNGVAISDTIALNGATEVAGVKIFDTVDSVDFPAKTNGSGDTVSIGRGSRLGLQHKAAHILVLGGYLNHVKEGTLPAVGVSSSALESNYLTLTSTLDGNQVDVYYVIG